MPEDPIIPPAAVDPAAAIKAEFEALKTQFAAQQTALAAMEAAKTALEREKLSDAERIKAELEDARKVAAGVDPLKQQLETYHSTFSNLYKEELATVPEGQRTAVEALSSKGNVAERLEALRQAKTLLGVAPGPMGQPLNPGGRGSDSGKPAFDPKNPPRLADITFKK